MITFDSVHFAYAERPVLSNLSLSLEAGSLHFLTGRSGAGKTTLLKLIYFALTPSAGALRVFDAQPPQTRAQRALIRRRMGLVLQDCELLDHLTLFDNIALPLRAAGVDPRRRLGDIHDLAHWVGLGDRLDARPAELSSGERQRAAVARAVIATPDIVIADEPTGDVDEEAAGRILELFLQLHASGATVLVATHDLGLVRRAQGRGGARTLRLENGAILRAGAAL